MRLTRTIPFLFSTTLAAVVSAQAQTVVEHSLATGAMGTAAAGGAKGASKSIGNVLGSVNKTLSKAGSVDSKGSSSTTSETIVTTSKPSSGAVSAKSKPGDLSIIRVGMARVELVKLVGKPMMKTSRVEGTAFVETFYYQGPDDVIVVTLRDGKVTEVVPPPPGVAKETALR